jgi:osmoprotectant transport system permease protein
MSTATPFFKWGYVTSQWGQISSDLLQHIALTLLAVAIGTVLSIPLAMLAWRYRAVRTPIFGIASALYIIPSLALFAILGPITGYVASYPTAEIALVGYTLLILIWNTVAGLNAVPAEAREAATAMGYSRNAALLRVDLPLALPYIFAGLRVATATVIGLVTVTALIGLGGLGQQITYGFTIGFNTPIIVGLVFSVALAAVFDLLIVGVQRLAVPWTRSSRRARVV